MMSLTVSKDTFNLEDAIQLAIGAFVLAVPISFSEEAWRIGETLPLGNLLLLVSLSLGFISLYAFQSVFQGNIRHREVSFFFRVSVAYAIALAVASLALLSLDKLPLFSDVDTALRRIAVIAMPASMGGIIVDGMDKE